MVSHIQDWRPGCSLELLQTRAALLQSIRCFFAERGVMEVETPLMCNSIGTDPHLDFFTTSYECKPKQLTLFLQTSPEFAMKRLLSSGSGSIYQICKAFRNGEAGRYHNPEFTLLEWYRVGYNLSQLMDEIADLLMSLFAQTNKLLKVQRISYQAVFQQHTGLDPLLFSLEKYSNYADKHGLIDAKALCEDDHARWLDFIFSYRVQPHLGQNTLWLVFEYPACFPSLARINAHNDLVTDRVEIFIDGVELGNGYYELTDSEEQKQRFDREIAIRHEAMLPQARKDKRLLAALESGLPECSGMAIGLDRILMLLTESFTIDDVLAFSLSKA
jgi:elongation factor P--(R)-beta-lysine ligase